ncbi:putative ribonuclease H-like domain-containing protein [Tanacetum coccineum]
MCDKKNSVLFTKTECLILSPSFKLLDESQVVLRAPRKDDVYSLDLKNIVPSGGITCLYANATADESKLWHRRLGHVNFKNINKLVKGHLVRGLPSKVFVNDHTCVACKKGKQHKASCLENQLNHNVKIIRCDNGTVFNNHAMNELCAKKGIKREFSVARTQQQNVHKILISGKDKEHTQEYILLPLHPHRTRILVEDIGLVAHEKPSESSSKDNDGQYSEDVANKEGQHQMTKDKQVLHDELEKMITQEVVAKALDDATRHAFEEEKRNIASKKRAAQATSINKLSTGRSSISTATTLYVSTASTPTGANADLPIDPNMPDLEDDSDAFSNDGIFNEAYDDENVGVVVDFNNMDDSINVSPIPTPRIHKDHPKDQILGDPKSALQTRGKIQKASSAQQALFKLQKVWILVDLPSRKKEEGIDYDEVFAPVSRIEEIMLFLAFASYMGFAVYQIDVKITFLYGTIKEEVYIHQPPGFVDPDHPNKVYKVIKALYGLHQAPRAWYETLSSFLMESGFRRGTIDKTLFIKKNKNDIIFQISSMGELTFFLGLQVKQQPDGIFISQDKYVADILKKFDFWSIRTATTPIESNKPLVKDEDGEDVDVHVYRSIIGSLMYLTASRLDFMDSPFELEAFSDSDYGGANLDKKSTTEYVAAANCCGQVLWIQNQMMDYGFNFMNTRIHIDNENTISVIKNPVTHSRTKHIEIRFHFIRDCYEKKLIEVIKIHTDSNVADLLTKGFDVTRLQELASPKQTVLSKANDLGKDFPNPFMAGSLPKTIKQSNDPPLSRGYTLGSGEDSLELMELMANCIQIVYIVRKKNREICTTEEGLQAIFATIDGYEKLITKASLRRNLKLEDAEGISSLSNEEIFKQLAHMGFIQLLLNKQQWLLLPHTRTYPTPTLTSKLFSNMRRASKGYSGVVTPLFEKPLQPTYKAEDTASMPHDSPLYAVHLYGSAEGSMQQHDLTILVNKLNDMIDGLEKDLQQTKKIYSTALTKLVLRVKKLEYKLKSGKARRKAKIVLSDDEEIAEDSSKQGRKISQINKDPIISLVQDEEETPTEIIEEHGSGEKGEMEISTASPPKVTKVSTAEAHVYTRRKAKDKGKAKMVEPATIKKVKKRTQVKLSMDDELARKMEEEERARFNAEQEARALQEEEEERLTLEATWELQKQLDERQQNKPVSIAQARRNMITYLKNQGGYKESYFKRMSYNDIRLILERVWDHVNTFIPIGSEVEKGSSKPSKRETSKAVEEEKVEEEEVNPEPVLIEKKAVGIRRKTLARRRESDKQGQENSKRQNKEKEIADYEEEKDELRMWLIVVPDEEAIVDPEVLHTKFPIVDWESQSLGNMHVYKVIRADGNTSYHKTFESMLKSFDSLDLEVLHRLVMKRFQDNTPEGYNLMLWGDLKILVDPEQDDDIWKNQNQ